MNRMLNAALFIVVFLSACSASQPPVTNYDASEPDLTQDIEIDMSPFPDGVICESQILCGPKATCCEVNQECIEDQCLDICASGIRCKGGTDGCCITGEYCFNEKCIPPTSDCLDSFDCEVDEFCEPTLGKCFPQPAGGPTCTVKPKNQTLSPTLEWSWTGSVIHPTLNQVINMPVVIDVNKDQIPEVLIVTGVRYSPTEPGVLRLLDGQTGQEIWPDTADVYADGQNGTNDYNVNPRSTPAAGDLDGDGSIEIVAVRKLGGLIAFDRDGMFLWESTYSNGTTPFRKTFASESVALADMNGDGKSEIVVGGVIFDHQGRLTNDSLAQNTSCGANSATYGQVSIIASLTNDQNQQVVCGNRAFDINGTILWDQSNTLTDGYPAVADFDGDGKPEVIVIAQGSVRIQDGATGALIASYTLSGTGLSGPPTIADFDADGEPEIASANGTMYNVIEYDSTSKTFSIRWSRATQDASSNVTGSSVFDFEGDGAAEVVYADECYARVFDGKTGSILFQVENSSATIHEYPVLVDVDGDNNTEFVIVANDYNHLHGSTTCGSGTYQPRHGVFVYGDSHDRWVRTRRVWNQHAYHISNVNSDGTIPANEPKSWLGTNTYRVSSQGEGVFNAPDLKVDLEVRTTTCPSALLLKAKVSNHGSLGVKAGVNVEFFLGTDATGTSLATKTTTKALLPGESESVEYSFPTTGQTPPFSFYVVVDGGSTSASTITECDETNNESSAAEIACPVIR